MTAAYSHSHLIVLKDDATLYQLIPEICAYSGFVVGNMGQSYLVLHSTSIMLPFKTLKYGTVCNPNTLLLY
jgi:hypothetical protein